MSKYPATFTVDEAGALLGISRRSAYVAIASGDIASFRVGKRIIIPAQPLLDRLGLSDVRS